MLLRLRTFTRGPTALRRAGRAASVAGLCALPIAAAFGLLILLYRQGFSAPPPPPIPSNLSRLDPAITNRVEGLLDAIAANPDDLQIRQELGMLYAANRLPEHAARCFQQLIELGTDDVRVWYHLAHMRAQLGDVPGALEAVAHVAQLEPDYAPAHSQRGLWLLDQGEIEPAEKAFKLACITSQGGAGGSLGLARVHLLRGRHGQAAEVLQQLLQAAPNHEYAHYLLGTAYRRLGRLDEAEAALRRGGTDQQKWPDPWRSELDDYRLGYRASLEQAEAAFKRGHFESAIAILDELRHHPSATVQVHNNLGACWMGTGRVDRALHVLQEAEEISPNSLLTHYGLASAYRAQMHFAPPQELSQLRKLALDHINRALQINPAHVPSLGLRGDLLAIGREVSPAIESYLQAARWDPGNPKWWGRAALHYGRLGKWIETADCLERVTSLSPSDGPAFHRLAVAYLSLGRLDQAEAALARAQDLVGRDNEQLEATFQRLNRLRTRTPAKENDRVSRSNSSGEH